MAMTAEDEEDADTSLANTFDDPNHNPFEDENDEERSVSSQQLRESFIRMTTQPFDHVGVAVGAPHRYDYSNYNQNGYVMISDTRQGQSLARAPTTPEQLATLIPIACVITHILFFYGQLVPMWNLALTAETISVWANSTTFTSNLLFDAFSWDHNKHFTFDHNQTVQEFTYGFAVKELWEAKGMADPWLAKVASLGLVVFSGIWPHLKLILLQYSWLKPTRNPNRRTKTLGWLALLGKWSLADVLTVCVMVGVLNLKWDLDPAAIKTSVVKNIHILVDLASQVWSSSQVCSWTLHVDASDCTKVEHVDMMAKCHLCKTFVDKGYENPAIVETTGRTIVDDILMGGGGTVRLSVKGMPGIYYFCAAVVFSVLLSVVVEWYNHLFLETLRKERGDAQTHTLSLTEEETPARTSSSAASALSVESDASEPLLLEDAPPRYEPMEIMDDSSVFSGIVQRTTSNPTYQWFQCTYIVPTITLIFVGLAVYLDSMERHVGGAIPELLKEILGVNFDQTYSLSTLMDTTGAAGGWDYLLMATFGLFCVLGPLLRAILVVLVAMSKPTEDTKRVRSLLVRVSNFLAAFCAWEVFLVAMVMVELIMPTATDTILNTDACRILSKDGNSCLRVEYERVHTTFACLVLGFIFIGLLSIHVSMEDQRERHPGEDEEVTRIQRPPPEIDTTPSYAMGAGDAIPEPHPEDDNDHPHVTTMIQEELV